MYLAGIDKHLGTAMFAASSVIGELNLYSHHPRCNWHGNLSEHDWAIVLKKWEGSPLQC